MERPFYRGLLGIGFTMSSFASKLLWKDTTILETAQNNPEITRANPRVTPIKPRRKHSRATFQKGFYTRQANLVSPRYSFRHQRQQADGILRQ